MTVAELIQALQKLNCPEERQVLVRYSSNVVEQVDSSIGAITDRMLEEGIDLEPVDLDDLNLISEALEGIDFKPLPLKDKTRIIEQLLTAMSTRKERDPRDPKPDETICQVSINRVEYWYGSDEPNGSPVQIILGDVVMF